MGSQRQSVVMLQDVPFATTVVHRKLPFAYTQLMQIFTEEIEDNRFAYARRIESAVRARFEDDLVPNSLEVSRELWTIRNQRRESGDRSIVGLPPEYSEGWGYHISPDLFFTVASICDHEQHLLRVLSKDACDLHSAVKCVDDCRILEGEQLFELGGSFLDLMVAASNRKRSYDAKFGKHTCLTVDSPPIADGDLQTMMANALFEETSGIIRTLVDGPASGKELRPIFKSLGFGERYYDEYRRAQSRIAAFELFAWARNQLAPGGFLVVNNVLSPAAVPTEEQLAFLGLAKHPALFERKMTGPGGDYRAAVHVFQAGWKRDVCESLAAVIEDYPRGRGRSQKRLRQRQWSWLDGKIVAKWV